jgi:hypothetical protein
VLPQYAQLGFNTISADSGQWRVFSTLAGGQVRAGGAADERAPRARREPGAAIRRCWR